MFPNLSRPLKGYLLMACVIVLVFCFWAWQDAQQIKKCLINEKQRDLYKIATSLEQRFPGSYELLLTEAEQRLTAAEKGTILNARLQPILREISAEWPEYGMGFYSNEFCIVAAIPEYPDFQGKAAPKETLEVYAKKQTVITYVDTALNKESKEALGINYPLFCQGEITGHIWAVAKIEDIEKQVNQVLLTRIVQLVIILLVILAGIGWIMRGMTNSWKMVLKQIAQGECDKGHFAEFPDMPSLMHTIEQLHEKDRSEYWEKEQVMAEMAQLDRMNLIGQIAAGMAHEVRNPMTVINGYVQMLMLKASPEDKMKYEIVLDELERVNAIVSDFLSLAQNKKSGTNGHDLSVLIEKMLPLIRAEAVKNNIDLDLKLEKGMPLILVEKNDIRQLILNLTRNSIEAMGQKGVLGIAAFFDGDKVFLRISDTGIGIPEEKLAKIFDPFFTTKETGTGLGLAICKSIVNRYNGTLAVESRPGGGTEFTIGFAAMSISLF